MAPELAVARGVARHQWSMALETARLPSWFVAGVAEYSARRAVAPLFEALNLPPGFAMLELRFFGGFVPRFVRIRLLPESDGDPLPAFRAHPDVGPASAPDKASALAGKTVVTLATLERWIGRPAFDAALAEFVRRSRGRQPTIDDFSRIVSAAAGQDLDWLLGPTLSAADVFDYGVADVRSIRTADGYDTSVVVERRGSGRFTGTSAAPLPPFERGRGVSIAVTFADGARVVDVWDGRDAQKILRYRSGAAVRSAELDPDRVMLIDVRRTNNSRTLAPRAATAATLWSLRWLAWLQQVMLTYAALA